MAMSLPTEQLINELPALAFGWLIRKPASKVAAAAPGHPITRR